METNTCDPALKLLNEELTSDIHKHKENIWKEHLDAHCDHRHTTHILWKPYTVYPTEHLHPHSTLPKYSTNKITTTLINFANYFTKQFTNAGIHTTHKTNRSINKTTHKIQGYSITLTTTQVQEQYNKVKITTHRALTN